MKLSFDNNYTTNDYFLVELPAKIEQEIKYQLKKKKKKNN